MRSARWLGFLILATGLAAGCGRPPAAPEPVAVEPTGPTAAQPKLPTLRLYLGARTMDAELALSPRQQETGMMFRTEMGTNDGMLFVFGEPHQASFWMKNTRVPLSIAYLGTDGTILEIHDLKPMDENPVRAKSDQILFALETPQGWFQQNGVGPGAVVTTDRGPLRRSFFGR
jgi:uncharacterized membrane protein (UPF0127 family)